jgi:lipopolysaccharide biosynthesis regulator YciM
MEVLLENATAVAAAIGLETSTRVSVKRAQGTLAFRECRFQDVVDLLEDIPAKLQKAGERSGRFAQLLAIAYRELGKPEEHNQWCRWLRDDCAEDKANGPAVAWAKAVLKVRETKLR